MSLPAPLENLRARLLAAWRDRAVTLKAMSFAMVGAVNTVVDACAFFLLLGYVTPKQTFLNVVDELGAIIEPYVANSIAAFLVESAPVIFANVGAWLTAITGSFVMNSLTTFSAETGGRPRLKHLPGFVMSGILAVTASTTAVVIAKDFMPVWGAKGIAILVSFAVNFSITHFVVFRTKSEPADAR